MSEKSKKDKKDLTVSQLDRQNILNNHFALQEIEKATRITGISFEVKMLECVKRKPFTLHSATN
jgi:hypothetical protein